MKLKEHIDSIYDEMVQIRRHLHQHPELSGQEHNTQKFILDYLKQLGIACEPIAGTGVIGTIGHQGPCIGIRADIDALPIKEQTNVAYQSKEDGIMHACGHDVHTTILLGTAKLLKSMEKQLAVRVKLLFEPAEETYGGAYPMIQEGALKDVDYVIGLHVMPNLKTGQVEIKYGQLNAASNTIQVKVIGKSSHGAYPDKGIDSIYIASELIQSYQSIVSRNTSPLNPVVLTIGSIHGGAKSNILCDEVSMTGTLRTLNPETRAYCLERIQSITECITKAHGADYELSVEDGYEALINDQKLVKLMATTFEKDFDVVFKEQPSLGVESFSYFSNRVPGAFYHIGCYDGKSDALHQCNFNVDEACIKYGILSQIQIILNMNN